MKKLTSIVIGTVAVCAIAASTAFALSYNWPKTLPTGVDATAYCNGHVKDIRSYISACTSGRSQHPGCVPTKLRNNDIQSCINHFK